MCSHLQALQNFRQGLYETLTRRRDGVMDLLDGLSSQTRATSVAEISLTPHFRRHYSALYKSIDRAYPREVEAKKRCIQAQQAVLGKTLSPQPSGMWCWGIDATSCPRPWAETLSDRQYVYAPTPVPGQKPVTLGHRYSMLSALPPQEGSQSSTWAPPLSVEPIGSLTNDIAVAQKQIRALLHNEACPWFGQRSVPHSAGSILAFFGDEGHSRLPHA